MSSRGAGAILSVSALVCVAALTATGQSFRVQCPTSTITHPVANNNNSEPAYTGSTVQNLGAGGYLTPTANVNGAIKCQQISGGDGYATMGDGTQTYIFSFGPLSGLADLANGLPGTEFPNIFNSVAPGSLVPGDPATTVGPATGSYPSVYGLGAFTYNGAVGLTPDLDAIASGACTSPC